MTNNPLPVRENEESLAKIIHDWALRDFRLEQTDEGVVRHFVWSIPGPLSVTTGIIRWWAPNPVMIQEISLTADTPPSGADLTIDIQKATYSPTPSPSFGLYSSIFTTLPTIPAGDDIGVGNWVYVTDGRFFKYRDKLRLDITGPANASDLMIMVRMLEMGPTGEIRKGTGRKRSF